jgi:hypothetical protein
MVQLKEKTVEELRKMASKKKIEGRSKMNKAQLVKALSKKKKMVGGALTDAEIEGLKQRDYESNPLYLCMDTELDNYSNIINIINSIVKLDDENLRIYYHKNNNSTIIYVLHRKISELTLNDDRLITTLPIIASKINIPRNPDSNSSRFRNDPPRGPRGPKWSTFY